MVIVASLLLPAPPAANYSPIRLQPPHMVEGEVDRRLRSAIPIRYRRVFMLPGVALSMYTRKERTGGSKIGDGYVAGLPSRCVSSLLFDGRRETNLCE